MLFDLTVKSHMMAHIALTAHEINPRRTWRFAGERMMFLVRRLGQSCSRGIKPHGTGRKLMTKYRCGLHLIFEDLCEWLADDDDGDLLDGIGGIDKIAFLPE